MAVLVTFDTTTFNFDDEEASRRVKDKKVGFAFLVMAIVISAPFDRIKNTVVVGELLEGIVNSAFSSAAVIVVCLSNRDKSCHLFCNP